MVPVYVSLYPSVHFYHSSLFSAQKCLIYHFNPETFCLFKRTTACSRCLFITRHKFMLERECLAKKASHFHQPVEALPVICWERDREYYVKREQLKSTHASLFPLIPKLLLSQWPIVPENRSRRPLSVLDYSFVKVPLQGIED